MKKYIMYICNRKRCEQCFDECRYTSDQEFAVRPEFDKSRFISDINGIWWEQEENVGD